MPDLKADPAYATNNQRVVLRPQLLAALRERLAHRTADELAETMERAGLPFAPIRKPEDLYDDPHLRATGGLADVRLPDGDKAGQTVKTTLLPFTMAGSRLGVRLRSAEARRAYARVAVVARAGRGRHRSFSTGNAPWPEGESTTTIGGT